MGVGFQCAVSNPQGQNLESSNEDSFLLLSRSFRGGIHLCLSAGLFHVKDCEVVTVYISISLFGWQVSQRQTHLEYQHHTVLLHVLGVQHDLVG